MTQRLDSGHESSNLIIILGNGGLEGQRIC